MVLCESCNKRVAMHCKKHNKIYWSKECKTCEASRLGNPKQYGKALLSPRQRLTGLEGQILTVCSKCGWFGHCEVHHKDKNGGNNNSDNLEILCPNCHTDKHFGKPKNYS